MLLVATLPGHPQLSTLATLISTTDYSTAAENDEVPDIQQFLDWKGCGAAQLLIPDAVKLPTIGVAWVHVA